MRFVEFLREAAGNRTTVSVSFRFAVPETARILAHYDELDYPTVLKEVGDRLEDVVGEPAMVRKTATFRAKNRWVVEPADEGKDGYDIDVISPMVPTGQVLGFVDKVTAWIASSQLRKADDFMQAAISVKGIEQSLDMVKLLFLLNPTGAARVVNRIIGKYPQPRIDVLIHKLKTGGRIPETYTDLHDAALEFLASKDTSKVSIGNVADGVIEFDLSGLQDAASAKQRITQLTKAIETACDQVAWRAEYVRHLQTAAKSTDRQRDDRVIDKVDELPAALNRLSRLDPGIASIWFDIEDGSAHDSMKEEVVKLIVDALATVGKHHQPLDRQEIQFFKRLLNRESVSGEDIDKFLRNDPATRHKIQKEFSL